MRPPGDRAEEPLVEGDHSQLWLRQRRLRFRSTPEATEDGTCSCRVAGEKGSASARQAIESSEILRGQREVQIVHAGEVYRLLVTRNNKLLLQK